MASETKPGGDRTGSGRAAPAPKALTAADFDALKSKPRRVEPVDVPELGGTVYVRMLSAFEKDQLDDALTDERGKPVSDNVRAKVFAACACDATGRAMFAFTPADVAEIGAWELAIVEPVYDAAMKLNRFRASDRAAEKKD
jgi:hypothetical protein